MNIYEQFIKRLSRGTTCYEHVKFIEEYKGFVIYHHESHNDWLGDQLGLCKAYLGYVKFNSDFDNIHWTTLFLHKADRVNARKSKKNIDHLVKTLIDGEIIINENSNLS